MGPDLEVPVAGVVEAGGTCHVCQKVLSCLWPSKIEVKERRMSLNYFATFILPWVALKNLAAFTLLIPWWGLVRSVGFSLQGGRPEKLLNGCWLWNVCWFLWNVKR